MSTALLAVFAVILCILFRILNVNSSPLRPLLVCKDQFFLSTILKIAPVIAEPYKPTRLWGFSGHVQTIIHSVVGRVRCPWPIGERVYIGLPDETTLTYDLYQPLTHGHEDDITIAICPGIGNSSESVYIRTFVHFVQCHGYRCAVLNHVGALSSVKITAPRIFSYGHTDDYNMMLQSLVEKHPNTKIVCIGYSLGGNLVTKYLGERGSNKLPNIIGGISICQGYNALEGTKILLNWQNFRRFYLYVMTESMKNLILRHKNMLLSEDVKQRCNLNERDIISAATLPELDEAYTRRVHNFRSVQELYKWSSCLFYLDNITTPMVFINALDDPIVPEMLLNPIKEHAGFRTGDSFLPARNFMEVIPQIEKSKVFKILRDLPKGSVLHAHDTAIVSLDYKLYNLTYRSDLYMCDANNTLRLKFFKTPDSTCTWQLLKDMRKNPKQADVVDERIRRQMTMVTEDPKKAYDTVNKAWTKFSSIFSFLHSFITYKPIYMDHLYRGLQEFYDDNVMYVELRSTLPRLYDLDGKTYGPLEVVRIQKEISERFTRDHPGFIGVRLIYAPGRLVSQQTLDDYLKTMVQLKEAFPDFVIGFDLVGQEDKGQPLITFANQLSAADSQIRFFFHAGETNWNGLVTDMNLLDAVLLNTKRIGHGYALTKHPFLWDLAKKMDIAVEICPISNQVLGLVNDMRNHPATSMFATGSPVVISNDDPGLWGAQGLTYDFYEAFMGLMSASSDLRSLKQLALNSLAYSSLNDVEKDNALAQWQDKWDAFVAKLAASQPTNEMKTDYDLENHLGR